MSEATKTQMQALIVDAKGQKAARDMANMDYKHTMKKLQMLADANPELAKELGIVNEKDEKKPDAPAT